ncbi:hypothetical protein PPYR_13351 [Photinus pyralis]|uniref:Uridine 5'-monophosphate synthase n=1 Tax=Photinus pyralis TaxID=7054 RepID=A0A5N4A8S8_PHOPY|nr:uridine 5'-monophosphate synthase [Photinus pyralis]KAB0793731.1 hypothetical protein PPYR_13351 [Photinus pyralis]
MIGELEEKMRSFAEELYKIGAVKIGEFITKMNIPTPIYIDLRLIVSFPKLIELVSDIMVEYLKRMPQFDIICGVPYAALPLASALSSKLNIPMVMRRKEAKSYGMRKMIEGVYKKGDRCLIIEDVVTSGSSILETFRDLKEVGIECSHTLILMDRQQGGTSNLIKEGITMHSLLDMTHLLKYLKEANYIDSLVVDKVTNYMATTQVDLSSTTIPSLNRLNLPFTERIPYAKNCIARELFQIMTEKQTNLCIAADVTKSADLINLANQTGPHICLFKTHIDILDDFHVDVIGTLQKIAEKHNFLLFEDRKFSDIGKTAQMQYCNGMYKIKSWAKVITAHSLAGAGMLDALKQSDNGIFLLAEISTSGSIIDKNYATKTTKLASQYPDLIAGLVCQSPLFLSEPGFIQLTPGVQLDVESDGLGQKYNTPSAVIEKGADIAVVGRGITQSSEPAVAAEKYKRLLWDAYLKRVK